MNGTRLAHAPHTLGAAPRLDPRPLARRLVGARAWAEVTPGHLEWRGAPPPPPPPPFVAGDRVTLRRDIRRDQKRLKAGTVATLVGQVTESLWSIAVAPREDLKLQVWLVEARDLEPAATEGAS